MKPDNPILRAIVELYPDEEIIVLDGFDEAILGITLDGDNYRIVYSVSRILDILIERGLSFEEAVEFYDFNIEGLNFGIQGPIYSHNPTYIPPNERFILN